MNSRNFMSSCNNRVNWIICFRLKTYQKRNFDPCKGQCSQFPPIRVPIHNHVRVAQQIYLMKNTASPRGNKALWKFLYGFSVKKNMIYVTKKSKIAVLLLSIVQPL